LKFKTLNTSSSSQLVDDMPVSSFWLDWLFWLEGRLLEVELGEIFMIRLSGSGGGRGVIVSEGEVAIMPVAPLGFSGSDLI